jgi:hypothetical protein
MIITTTRASRIEIKLFNGVDQFSGVRMWKLITAHVHIIIIGICDVRIT